MSVFRYFKELLALLRSIDRRLEKLERCVQPSRRGMGDYAVNTKHWND